MDRIQGVYGFTQWSITVTDPNQNSDPSGKSCSPCLPVSDFEFRASGLNRAHFARDFPLKSQLGRNDWQANIVLHRACWRRFFES
jgi:hypothetical protein